jgi:hypothetical protein
MVIDGIKRKVEVFLYFFEIFKVNRARPKLQMVAIKSIFANKIKVSLKGSRGK